MEKISYDLNHSQIYPNDKTNGVQNIRRDSIIDGVTKTSTSRYVSDCYNCSLPSSFFF
jgi:hypothetical protein